MYAEFVGRWITLLTLGGWTEKHLSDHGRVSTSLQAVHPRRAPGFDGTQLTISWTTGTMRKWSDWVRLCINFASRDIDILISIDLLALFLAKKFQEAEKMYKKQKIVFEELDRSIPKVKTDIWREVPIKAAKVDQKWTIPFESAQTGGNSIYQSKVA
jgi:hypothetical protein